MLISEGHTTLSAESSSRSVTVDGWKYVKDYTFFTELKDCGYIDGGRCGYIAAAMLLAYDAVLVYGYYAMSDTTQFVAHFGWPGATKVYFSGVLGSLYAYEW